MKIETQEISSDLLEKKGIHLFIKRIDRIHQYISGNKWYKLTYNIIEAKKNNCKTIVTFGGAFSNHILSTAFIAKINGFSSVGLIRGEETLPLNFTLQFAKDQGMKIEYVDRSTYKLKHTDIFLKELKNKYNKCYIIPEGGTNDVAIKGCEEILSNSNMYNFICCPIGTGGTLSGIINATNETQNVLGFSAVKGVSTLKRDINRWTNKNNWDIISSYNFGGFAKFSDKLLHFVIDFYHKYNIPLDLIYTGKMMYGIMEMIQKNYFAKGTKILIIHTGGLQGNQGMNQRFSLNLPHDL